MQASFIHTGDSDSEEDVVARSTSRNSNRSDGLKTSGRDSTAADTEAMHDDADSDTSSVEQSDTVDKGEESEDALQKANGLALSASKGFKGNRPQNIISNGQVIKNQVIHNGKIVSQDIASGSPRSGSSSRSHSNETRADRPLGHTQSEDSGGESVSWGNNGFPVLNVAGGKLTINGKTIHN